MTTSQPPGPAVPLYGTDFAADPQRTYAMLRARGPVALVELAPGVPATLVTDYATALKILHSPQDFAKDSRTWQASAPPDAVVLPMMAWRPNTLFADGGDHARLRPPVTDSLRRTDPAALRRFVHDTASGLIDAVADRGHADLIADYAAPLPLQVLHLMFGCTPALSARMAAAMRALWDGSDPIRANEELEDCVRGLIAAKRSDPGDDVTTRLLQHPHGLTDDELLHQLVVMMGAGVEPVAGWIGNALWLLLTETRFAENLVNGGVAIADALDDVLWRHPPLANYAITYPVRPVRLGGTTLPAHEPVVISIAAANTDPAVVGPDGHVPTGNRAHLAFSAGPHGCPAHDPARLIATVAIEALLDALPGLRAAPDVHLHWRPGPFHRALSALPVVFPARTQRTTGGTPCPHHATST
ncbi:cytochrome P450 [Saccharopolyspora cebuensis]|uniref:Cytochrome P450 n=1 Tax=Saccharopolyspora cebuensis TaxID=418759 RepID=A0ABV4CPA1_9PSEU